MPAFAPPPPRRPARSPLAGRGLPVALLLVTALAPVLAAFPAPAPAGAQAQPATTVCLRRHVPNPPTLTAMTGRYPRQVNAISATDFQSLAVGSAIPDSTQDPTGFAQALQAIYGSPGTACTQQGRTTGDLIQASGSDEIDVVAAAPPVATPTAMPTPAPETVTVSFEHTGQAQTWTAPAGVTRATFAVFGAQGGAAGSPVGSVPGGNGAWAVADLAVAPGAAYQINVGGRGGDGSANGTGGAGGSNGGGAGGTGYNEDFGYNNLGAGGGGGASDVRSGGFSAGERLLVAGGGGGAGYVAGATCAGTGQDGYGGAAGQSGVSGHSANGIASLAGGGASPTTAGAGGNNGQGIQPGASGGAGPGGAGDSTPETCPGGGGGGGFFGGGGGGGGFYDEAGGGSSGSSGGGGGGGGSSSGPPGTVYWAAVQTGEGQVIVTYAGSPVGPTATPTRTPAATATATATATPTPPAATATATATGVPATATATATGVPSTATATATATPPPSGGGLTAQITSCSAQGDAYACTLQVTLGAAQPVNTVLSVTIDGATYNPSDATSPQVASAPGCPYLPNPSPYLDLGGYTRYDLNISTDGCAAGAVVTVTEAIAGAAGTTIAQTVTVPGLQPARATFVLPS